MPEHLHDPIRELENFDSGGLGMTPLDPAQVRRLGDRRRTRRHALLVVAAAVAVVAAASPAVFLADHDGSGAPTPALTTPPTPTPTPGRTPTPSPTPTSPTTSTTPHTPNVITYPDGGIQVVTEADTAKLTGTTAAFKAFVAARAATDGASCTGTDHGVTVQKYSSAGYALGGMTCGGYRALWVDHEDRWQEGFGTQDTWDCPTLKYFGVPRSFVGDCISYAGDFGPDEVDGLRIGMTAAQVEAVGATVTPDPAGGCSGFVLPHRTATAGAFDGSVSPTKGLVGIFARPGMKTPEKIGLGSTKAEFRAAYPDATFGIDYWSVPLAHGTRYEVLIDQHDMVYEIALAADSQDCFG